MIEGLRACLRRTSGEERVFGFALAALALHVVVDALTGGGVARALGAIAATVLAPALFIVLARRSSPRLPGSKWAANVRKQPMEECGFAPRER